MIDVFCTFYSIKYAYQSFVTMLVYFSLYKKLVTTFVVIKFSLKSKGFINQGNVDGHTIRVLKTYGRTI